MKSLLLILLAALISGTAYADEARVNRLMSKGIVSGAAAELDSSFQIDVDSSGNTEIDSAASKTIELKPQGLEATKLAVSSNGTDVTSIVFGNGTPDRASLAIRGATTDGDDDGFIIIGPGGSNSLERGSAIVMYANETTGGNAGDLKLDCGNVANSVVEVITPQTVGDSGSYKVRWYWQQGTGNFYNDATDGGNIVLQKTGTTLDLESATAASACKGTGQYNGTTAVVVSTTCAATGDHISITPTSDPTGSTAAQCWYTISNGVSFSVDCDQANDSTFSWVIIK